MKFTEGKWSRKLGSRGVFVISTRDDGKQKIIAQIQHEIEPEEMEGNIALMLKAPEMFEAIKYLQKVAKLKPSNLDKLIQGECNKILKDLPD